MSNLLQLPWLGRFEELEPKKYQEEVRQSVQQIFRQHQPDVERLRGLWTGRQVS